MVGVDPAMVLCYRDEYREVLGDGYDFDVKLANEWLLDAIKSVKNSQQSHGTKPEFTWFSHCSESTAKPNTGNEWQQIFAHFGAQLHAVNLGCCGMAGTYGHELDNQQRSRDLFDMSWEKN